jgi:hypothetical protein
MSRSAKVALALWFLLAVVVFSVTFDWKTRMAGHAFVAAQLAHRRQGEPVQTINDGFRPLVRLAALDASKWLVSIAAAGAVLIGVAEKRTKLDA